jgi:hypothetical protein
MRRLAEGIQRDHPELAVHDHVRDAARTLESGNEEASQRHLRAAMYSLTPQSLMRNGVHDDIGHISARQAVHGVHRHLLLVKDIADVAAKNQAAIRRDSYGDYESGPTLPHADPNAGYGPGALAQKPTQRQPGGDRALNAPDRTNSGGSDPAVADPVGPQPKGSKQFARTWDELAGLVVDLSARTAQLEATPAPRGKPGGPGLYDVKGMGHEPYLQQIVKALIRKRGMPPGKAYAIARGAIRKWAGGGGHVHPEVRAAAGAAEAGELEKQARAKAMHGHANTWDELGAVIDLAAAPRRGWDGVALELAAAAAPAGQQGGGTLPPRVPAGSSAGGQFGAAQGSPPPAKPAAKAKAAPAKAKAPAAKPKPKPAAKAAPKKLTGVAAQKASLLATAKSKRTQAQALIKKIIAAQAQIKALNAAGAKSTAANAAATASAGQTASTSNVTATSAPAAASSTTAAASPAKATAAAPTAASLTKQVTAWQGQVKTLLGQAATATAQAGKL